MFNLRSKVRSLNPKRRTNEGDLTIVYHPYLEEKSEPNLQVHSDIFTQVSE
jgi:hypothetical protein